jgi:hypothetical protein
MASAEARSAPRKIYAHVATRRHHFRLHANTVDLDHQPVDDIEHAVRPARRSRRGRGPLQTGRDTIDVANATTETQHTVEHLLSERPPSQRHPRADGAWSEHRPLTGNELTFGLGSRAGLGRTESRVTSESRTGAPPSATTRCVNVCSARLDAGLAAPPRRVPEIFCHAMRSGRAPSTQRRMTWARRDATHIAAMEAGCIPAGPGWQGSLTLWVTGPTLPS